MLMRRILLLAPVILGLVAVRGVAQDAMLGPPSTDPTCANPPMDHCGFYANCLESRYQCGPDGYPLRYGQYYCQKFSDDRAMFDAHGQRWMLDTMHCLQQALVDDAVDATPPSGDCGALQAKAMATHARCYVDNGLCTLGVWDWAALMEILGVEGPFWSLGAMKAMVETAEGCGMFYASLVKEFSTMSARDVVLAYPS